MRREPAQPRAEIPPEARLTERTGLRPALEQVQPARGGGLVFTSAGAYANLDEWTAELPRFDVIMANYAGPAGAGSRSASTWYFERQGSKFQNLSYATATWPELFRGYDAVFVADDDVRISTSGINRLFELRRARDLFVLAPTYLPHGRHSHRIMRVSPITRLRYTNFVEVTCPVVRTDKLLDFLTEEYDPLLVGFGVDWWLAEYLGGGAQRRIALSDDVRCVNPHEREKGGVREIDRLQPETERRRIWGEIKAQRGLTLENVGPRVLSAERRRGFHLARGAVEWLGFRLVR